MSVLSWSAGLQMALVGDFDRERLTRGNATMTRISLATDVCAPLITGALLSLVGVRRLRACAPLLLLVCYFLSALPAQASNPVYVSVYAAHSSPGRSFGV